MRSEEVDHGLIFGLGGVFVADLGHALGSRVERRAGVDVLLDGGAGHGGFEDAFDGECSVLVANDGAREVGGAGGLLHACVFVLGGHGLFDLLLDGPVLIDEFLGDRGIGDVVDVHGLGEVAEVVLGRHGACDLEAVVLGGLDVGVVAVDEVDAGHLFHDGEAVGAGGAEDGVGQHLAGGALEELAFEVPAFGVEDVEGGHVLEDGVFDDAFLEAGGSGDVFGLGAFVAEDEEGEDQGGESDFCGGKLCGSELCVLEPYDLKLHCGNLAGMGAGSV